MTVADQLRKDGYTNDELIKLYQQAADEIAAIIAGADTSQGFARYRLQQFRAIQAVIARNSPQVQEWVDSTIPDVMQAANDETNDAMKGFADQGFSFRFSGVNQEAVKYLTTQASEYFVSTLQGLKTSGLRASLDKRALANRVIKSVIQGQSVAKTQTQLVDILKNQGFTLVIGKKGRRLNLEDYSQTLVRTQTINAYNVSAQQTMLSAGRRFAIFPTIPAQRREPDDICWKYEKQKYIDLLKDPVPPLHPRCRHTLQPVSMDQLKEERPDLYDQAVAYYKKASN